MKFTANTLTSTSRRFEQALKARGLTLSFSTADKLWAQIVVGKNMSAAKAQANAEDHIQAINISAESIRTKLKERSREISQQDAIELFAEAIQNDLYELSPALCFLVGYLNELPQSSLNCVSGDPTGLGIIDTSKPGYIPVQNLRFPNGHVLDAAWTRPNAELIVETLNLIAGINREQYFDILAANVRLGLERQDDAFSAYFVERVDSFSRSISLEVLKSFDPGSIETWNLDFDFIKDIVYDVVECEVMSARRNGTNWLKPDCGVAGILMNHTTAQIRETLQLYCREIKDGDDPGSLDETLEWTAKLSAQKVFKIQAGSA